MEMEENLTATRATKSANKEVETRIKMEYDKLFKALQAMKSDFLRQEQAKNERPLDVTERNYVQKITSMLALTTNHIEFPQTHCTRTKEEFACVKTHLDDLIREMKDVTKKN